MQKSLPEKLSQEIICQLTKEELVELVIRQQEVEKLKASRDLDSKTSSKPPSTGILKKTEQKPEENEAENGTVKRKPGGHPGHPGKTRKGFNRIDRIEVLRPQMCSCCGQTNVPEIPIKIETGGGAAPAPHNK